VFVLHLLCLILSDNPKQQHHAGVILMLLTWDQCAVCAVFTVSYVSDSIPMPLSGALPSSDVGLQVHSSWYMSAEQDVVADD